MDVIVTYDLEKNLFQESKHFQVKNEMKALGYLDRFTVVNKTTNIKQEYFLPNSTLWKKDTNAETVKRDLLTIAKQQGAIVERMIATKFSDWAAIPGKAYAR